MLRTVSGASLGYQTVMSPDGEDALSAGRMVIPTVPAPQAPPTNTRAGLEKLDGGLSGDAALQ